MMHVLTLCFLRCDYFLVYCYCSEVYLNKFVHTSLKYITLISVTDERVLFLIINNIVTVVFNFRFFLFMLKNNKCFKRLMALVKEPYMIAQNFQVYVSINCYIFVKYVKTFAKYICKLTNLSVFYCFQTRKQFLHTFRSSTLSRNISAERIN